MGGGLMNTNICTRSLFFAPKLWEPHLRWRFSISVAERSFSLLDHVQRFVKPMPQLLLRSGR